MTSPNSSTFGFVRRNQTLYCENVDCAHIAKEFGTPCYVYSRAVIEHNLNEFEKALSEVRHEIRYALKANSAAGILQIIAKRGLGVDTVSEGEIRRARRAGIPAEKIVFSGVGKTDAEIRYALQEGIGCFNVESVAELHRLNDIATQLDIVAPFSIRCNPDVDAQTHPYISTGLKKNKFGVPIEFAEKLYLDSANHPYLKAVGVDAHIGSQILDPRPHTESAHKLIDLILTLKREGIELEHIDIGGGYGIAYEEHEKAPALAEFFTPIITLLKKAGLSQLAVMVEPGRSIVASAGVLLSTVQYMKDTGSRVFCITDTGMNDLIRPSLYSAWMNIEALHPSDVEPRLMDVVGPVCESADFLGKERKLAVGAGDILVVFDAGAYGASMASHYNSRALPTEILVDEGKIRVLRAPEAFDDIISGDNLISL